MALSTGTLSFLFLAVLLLLSHHSQARDSQFFSKVTNNNEKKTTTTTMTPATMTTVVNPNSKKESDEPVFYPETQNDGYGLYGHEFSPTADGRNEQQHYTETNTNTQTTYEPYTTPVGRNYGAIEGANLYATNSNDNDNDNNNNNRYNHNENNNKYNDNENNKYNVQQRQGMSDTRFMEGGKYFHDVSADEKTTMSGYNPGTYDEKSYDPNTYRSYGNNNNNRFNTYDNSKVIDYSNPKNWYNNRGNNNNYYGGNNGNTNSYETTKYNDNDNYYNNRNNNNEKSFEGYQNEQEFQP